MVCGQCGVSCSMSYPMWLNGLWTVWLKLFNVISNVVECFCSLDFRYFVKNVIFILKKHYKLNVFLDHFYINTYKITWTHLGCSVASVKNEQDFLLRDLYKGIMLQVNLYLEKFNVLWPKHNLNKVVIYKCEKNF